MRDPIRLFMDAVLAYDTSILGKLLKSFPSEHPLRPCCAVVADSFDPWNEDPAKTEAVLKELCRQVDSPPADADLLLVVLLRIAGVATFVGRINEAQRAMRTAERLSAGKDFPPEVRAHLALHKSRVLGFMGEYRSAQQEADRGLEAVGPDAVEIWRRLKMTRLNLALLNDDLDTAEHDLADIEALPAPRDAQALPLGLIRAEVLKGCGRLQEALAALDAFEAGPMNRRSRAKAAHTRISLLLLLGRVAEARQLIERSRELLTDSERENRLALAALTVGELDVAREHCRRSAAAPGTTPTGLKAAMNLLVGTELCARRPRVARLLLKSLDLAERDPTHALHGARLCLLEGDEAGAIERFRRALAAMRPEQLVVELRTVHELSAAELSRLWLAALEPGTGRAPDAAPTTPAALTPATPPAPAPSGPERRAGRAALVGESAAVCRVRTEIGRLAPLEETVLVTGETGTGKELVARILHSESPRAAEPFLAVNCAAISDTLLESELFGHVRGAFTGAERHHDGLAVAAGKGTLFFDEIGSMSPRLQGALLRMLEERRVRPVGSSKDRAVAARFVAASNQPLEELVKAGTFRADLYYRLARLEIRLPALRERIEDIPLLARHFLGDFFEYGEVALGDDLLAALRAHPWPGNVRELQNEVRRIAVLAGESKLLGAELFRGARPAATVNAVEPPGAIPAAATPARAPVRDRLGRLRELFRERKELSRGDVVRLLGCAPGTAAKDLAHLEAEGFIRRVWTSPSPRTSYFTISDGGQSSQIQR